MSRPGTETYSPGQHVQNFTDREEPLKLILAHLEAPEDQWLPALAFWGVGGIGKTWLTLKLQAHLQGSSNTPGFLESEADAWGRVPKLPCARLDFDPIRNPLGGNYQNDPLVALTSMRAQVGVPCPQYDLASTMLEYRQGNGALPAHRLSDHANVAWTIVKGLDGIAISHFVPVVGGLVAGEVHRQLEKVGKQFKHTPLMQWVLQQTDKPFMRELRRADAQQLAADMSRYLAEDLNENLPVRNGKHCRAVLIFDTYEEMQILDGNTVRQARRDEWIREFFKRLDHVLIIIAGRDYVRWAEQDSYFDQHDAEGNPVNLEQHLLGGLSRKDAGDFLGKCGITAPPLQRAVLRVCIDDETDHPLRAEMAYHPFSLGLCADTIANEGGKTDPASFQMSPDRVQALARRFLRSLPTEAHRLWVEKLAITWRFDREAGLAAYTDMQSREADATWKMLARFSFVIRLGGSEWFTLHTRMRSAIIDLFASEPERLLTEHLWWQTYWQSRSKSESDPFAALAWAHHFRLEPKSAINEWHMYAGSARNSFDMSLHNRFIDWWTPLDLELQQKHTVVDALALNTLGQELWQSSLGDRSRNLRRCIACFEAALRVFTEERFPQDWAGIQNNLSIAYCDLPTGDRGENLNRAIACHEAALRVRTEKDFPLDWAMTQNNLATVYFKMPTGDRIENLHRAIACLNSALRVYSEEQFPLQWAGLLNNLGNAYSELPTGDRNENLRRAIAYFEATLRVRLEGDFPQDWAMTQNNLGNAYSSLPTGNRAENLTKALTCYEATLRVHTIENFPQQWAGTQNNIAINYFQLPIGDRSENLTKVIASFEAALRVYTIEAFPIDWAMTQNHLAMVYRNLLTGDRGENLQRAIACSQAALRVYSEEQFPQQWAGTMNNLGNAYRNLPTGDRHENLRSAIACYEAALRVRVEEVTPQ